MNERVCCDQKMMIIGIIQLCMPKLIICAIEYTRVCQVSKRGLALTATRRADQVMPDPVEHATGEISTMKIILN